MKTSKFEKELSDLLNRYSKENGSNTPDFILAQYLQGCLDNFDRTVRDRDWWYRREEAPSLRYAADSCETKKELIIKYTKIPNTTDSITLPAGKYYIGDLCYVFEDDDWGQFCSDAMAQPDEGQHGSDITNGGFEVNGKKLWYHGTAYGDGVYPDQNGHVYSVDAGLIGVLPFELVVHRYENLYKLGNVVEYDYDFECSYEDGTFYIGPLHISTGDDEDYDDDGEYSYGDYEDQ